MFGFLNRLRGTETRSSEIDLGALFQSVFAFGGGSSSIARSPAILVSSLGVQDNAGALLTESRRLGRTSPLLLAYRAVIECGVLTGEPEAPEFGDTVPEAVAQAVADLWVDMHDCDRERDLLDRLVLDGEFLELDRWHDSSARRFRADHGGAEVEPRGRRLQDRHGFTRPHVGPALCRGSPHGRGPRLAVGLCGASLGGWPAQRPHRAAHALGTMAKIASVVSNGAPGPDHRVGRRAVRPRRPSRDGGSRATADQRGEYRIGPVPAAGRGSEAHPKRPGRNGEEI